MKTIIALFLSCLSLVAATNPIARVLVTWDPNPEPDIGGYKIYHGTNSRVYDVVIDVGNVTNTIVTNLTRGATYYFAATAYNTIPLESDFSNEAIVSIPAPPVPPAGLKATNPPVVEISALLQSAPDPAGPWVNLVNYPTNQFHEEGPLFLRIMGIVNYK